MLTFSSRLTNKQTTCFKFKSVRTQPSLRESNKNPRDLFSQHHVEVEKNGAETRSFILGKHTPLYLEQGQQTDNKRTFSSPVLVKVYPWNVRPLVTPRTLLAQVRDVAGSKIKPQAASSGEQIEHYINNVNIHINQLKTEANASGIPLVCWPGRAREQREHSASDSYGRWLQLQRKK